MNYRKTCRFREQKSKGAKMWSAGDPVKATVTVPSLPLSIGLKNFKGKSGKGDEEKHVSPHVLWSRGESGSTAAQGVAGCPMKEAEAKSPAPGRPQTDLSKPAGCPPPGQPTCRALPPWARFSRPQRRPKNQQYPPRCSRQIHAHPGPTLTGCSHHSPATEPIWIQWDQVTTSSQGLVNQHNTFNYNNFIKKQAVYTFLKNYMNGSCLLLLLPTGHILLSKKKKTILFIYLVTVPWASNIQYMPTNLPGARDRTLGKKCKLLPNLIMEANIWLLMNIWSVRAN